MIGYLATSSNFEVMTDLPSATYDLVSTVLLPHPPPPVTWSHFWCLASRLHQTVCSSHDCNLWCFFPQKSTHWLKWVSLTITVFALQPWHLLNDCRYRGHKIGCSHVVTCLTTRMIYGHNSRLSSGCKASTFSQSWVKGKNFFPELASGFFSLEDNGEATT